MWQEMEQTLIKLSRRDALAELSQAMDLMWLSLLKASSKDATITKLTHQTSIEKFIISSYYVDRFCEF